jgi:hypothetical protein
MNKSDQSTENTNKGSIACMARNLIVANLLMIILIGGGIWTMYSMQKEVCMDVEPKNAVNRVLESVKTEVLPQLRADFPGITWSFEGSTAEKQESTSAVWGGFGLAMFIIFALLVIAFGSYSQPLIVMAAIPFGIVGAVHGRTTDRHFLQQRRRSENRRTDLPHCDYRLPQTHPEWRTDPECR